MSTLTGFYSDKRCCSHCTGSLTGQHISACQCGNFFHTDNGCARECEQCSAEFCTQCTAFTSHVCSPVGASAPILAEESDDSLATDNDSDGEIAAMTIAETEEVFTEACTQQRFLEKGASMGDDALVPEGGVYLNRISGTAHMSHKTEPEKSACGVYMNPLCFAHENDEYSFIGATLCWRSGCACWLARPVEEPVEEPVEASPIDWDGGDL